MLVLLNFFSIFLKYSHKGRKIPDCVNMGNGVFVKVFHSYHLKMLSIHKSQMNIIFVLHKNIIGIYL